LLNFFNAAVILLVKCKSHSLADDRSTPDALVRRSSVVKTAGRSDTLQRQVDNDRDDADRSATFLLTAASLNIATDDRSSSNVTTAPAVGTGAGKKTKNSTVNSSTIDGLISIKTNRIMCARKCTLLLGNFIRIFS